MVEVMIEQWKNLDGSVDFLWSVWQAGTRIQMGGAHDTGEEAEMEAREYCLRNLGTEPASITRV